jgi:hypothetical protein
MGACCDTDLQEEKLPIFVLNPNNALYDRAHRCRVVDIQPIGLVAKADDFEGRLSKEFFVPHARLKQDAPNWTARLGDGVFIVD